MNNKRELSIKSYITVYLVEKRGYMLSHDDAVMSGIYGTMLMFNAPTDKNQRYFLYQVFYAIGFFVGQHHYKTIDEVIKHWEIRNGNF